MIYWLYERLLKRRLQKRPSHICFLITAQDMADAPRKIVEVTGWCLETGIHGITFHIATANPSQVERFLPYIREIGSVAELHLRFQESCEIIGTGTVVEVAIGKSGREEIATSIRRMAEKGIRPEEVDEKMVESFLTYRYNPDLLIKTGGSHLTDFLIWQSVYSELFFSDVNWKFFRKIDFLRALRDFQSRERRFGG